MKKILPFTPLLFFASVFFFGVHIAFAANTAGTGNFVPLTNLPVLSGLTTAPTFPAFFNALYKYAIGIAATLAVLQIIRAGILYMGGDSVTETKQARDLIGSAVLGLVLVLSPFLIFSIINPKILSLQVGFGALAPNQNTSQAPAPTGGTAAGSATGGAAGTALGTALGASVPTNTKQYQLPAGTYLYLQEYKATGQSCLTLSMIDTTDQSKCQSEVKTYQTGFSATPNAPSYTVLYNCTAPADGSFSVPTTNLCSSQPYFPLN